MSDPTFSSEAPDSMPGAPTSDAEALAEIRGILAGPQEERIEEVAERVEDPELRARDVGQVLPEAIIFRAAQDERLSEALGPTIEESLKSSVRRNPGEIVEAISPVMAPAIRKAITSALRNMIHSLSQLLEQGFSWRGIKWRLESLRTGRSYAEVVLLHTLIYRVEQVFLIHRETGLLLQHVAAESVTMQDSDMVSGMLTAIQDFVRDSFGADEKDTVDTLQMGELTVWIEPGSQAILAVVIRGSPPADLRRTMQGAIEAVHLEQGETLKTFEGDTAPFEKSRRHIESCLQQARQETDRRGISILTWAILLAIAAGLGYWIFSSMRQERLWRRYVERLDSGPGLAVTRWEEDWSVYRLWGLRDPFAEDPYAIAGEMGVDFEDFIAHWEPYSSGDPQLVFDRLVLLLEPPAGVTLSVDRGVAYARGRASHRWIVRARKRIAELPVSLPYVDDQLVDTDWNALLATKSHVETVVIQFPRSNSADLSASEVRKLDRLTRDIRDMAAAAQAFGALVKVSVFGHTSRTGSEELNVTLSQARADAVAAYLVSKGFDRSIFTPIGVGWNDPARQETTETDRAANRRVSFKVDVIGVLKP